MKKIIFALVLVVVLCMNVAFADLVVDSFELFGQRIPLMIASMYFIILIFAFIVIMIIFCKTKKSKTSKIIVSVLIGIISLGIVLTTQTIFSSRSRA